MGKTKFQAAWLQEFPWLTRVLGDEHSAWCTICLQKFKIDNQGRGQVTSHAKCHETSEKKRDAAEQRTFKVRDDGAPNLTANNSCILSDKEQVTKAEILDALYVVRANHSFASVSGNAERYRMMFGEKNPVASCYSMCETKVAYIIKFGIAPYVRRKLVKDLADTPFSFLFDETTTSQVKKQYDGYVIYWSSRAGKVVHQYCGSLFVGHCDADALVNHYTEFAEAFGLDSSMLLHFGMDGPNTNLSFEKKMKKHLEEFNQFFLQIGTCSLHPVHTAFANGVKKLFKCEFVIQAATDTSEEKKGSFDMDEFFHDLHFFFKRSSARREDYASLESVTGIVAWYTMRHAETRWVSMKYVALRVLEQWDNLKEYFMKFLPKQSSFKRDVEKTLRYKRICAAFSEPLMQACVSFVGFISQDFEDFLVPFQAKEPMIHLLYPAMCKLMDALQKKFVKKK